MGKPAAKAVDDSRALTAPGKGLLFDLEAERIDSRLDATLRLFDGEVDEVWMARIRLIVSSPSGGCVRKFVREGESVEIKPD